MAKPFININYNRKGDGNSIISTLDYITRNEEYSNRQDLFSVSCSRIPDLFDLQEGKGDLEKIKDFYESFIAYSRKDRKTNLNIIFDLPITNKKENFEKIEPGIYNRIVDSFINKIHDEYKLVGKPNEKMKVYKKSIAEKLIEGNANLRLEDVNFPIVYAIHKLEKSKKDNIIREHPHCHLIISTICFDNELLKNKNLTKEMLIRKAYNNEQFSKVAFYYNIYRLLTDSVNEELKKLSPEKQKYIDKFFVNMKNQNILKSEKEDINLITAAFKNIEAPNLSYIENLKMNKTFTDNAENIKKIEQKLKKISENKKKVIDLFDIRKNDKKLIDSIIARNKLYKRLIYFKPENEIKIEFSFQKSIEDEFINFNSYKIYKNIEEGIPILDAVKEKVYLDKEEIIPYFFNYGSMKDYLSNVKEKIEMFEIDGNCEEMFFTLDKLSNEYLDAVNKFNNITPFKKKEIENKLKMANEINDPQAIEVMTDTKKFVNKKKKMIDKVAILDYQILSAFESRSESNLLKQFYLTGTFGEDIEELSLEDYLEENSEVRYTINGRENIVKYNIALQNLDVIKNQINILREKLKQEKEILVRNAAQNDLNKLLTYKDSIEAGLRIYEQQEKPKLIDKFNQTIKDRTINLTKSKKELYSKEITLYKKSLENSRLNIDLNNEINRKFKTLKDNYLEKEITRGRPSINQLRKMR